MAKTFDFTVPVHNPGRPATTVTVQAREAFTIFGEEFIVHRKLYQPEYWVVSHKGTGCCASPYGFRTSKGAIDNAKSHIEAIGEAALRKSISIAHSEVRKAFKTKKVAK